MVSPPSEEQQGENSTPSALHERMTSSSTSQSHSTTKMSSSTESDEKNTTQTTRPLASADPKPQTPSTSNETTSHPPLQRSTTNSEPRRCWICFSDETEDTPTSSAWKSPCPCALTAHESCILDWVADLEAPARGQRTPKKIECPQCKGEIRIARPRSPIAEGVRRIDRILTRLTVPGIALTLVGSLTAGAWVHGLMSIYVVFGPAEFATLFRMQRQEGPRLGSALAAGLVPVGLVLGKTSIADSVLPVIPVLFFATQYTERPRNGFLWPPSPSTAFVTLPYIKGLYDIAWHHLFAAKERQWIKEVNPRAEPAGIRFEWTVRPRAQAGNQEPAAQGGAGAGARGGGQAAGQPAAAPPGQAQEMDDDEEDELEIELEGLEIAMGPADEDDAPPQVQAGGEGNANANADEGQANGEGAQGQAAGGGGGGGALDNANQLIDTGGRIADAVMGALCFPFVAAAAGELLRIFLPARFVLPGGGLGLGGMAHGGTSMRGGGLATGLLQMRWGRSFVGGCLYVVIKDTLRLYARYRLAVSQRQRHVLDYEGKSGKGRRSGRPARERATRGN